MEIALFQPDIAPNVGTLIRLGACMNSPVHIIEPCGFPFGAKDLRRSAMDYANLATVTRHSSWDKFRENTQNQRILLLTTKTSEPYVDFSFKATDILLLGRESAGVPAEVHETVDARLTIPMQEGARSINVALSASMVLGEALRQTNAFPKFKQGLTDD
ncbi:tRNA (cytidine(34)-2'-O)-methyltransferase [Sneathiella limimaris]|uniref:tRNA (cytidine(34)-2'-O)-methyltransferase n=1 Tax=Sneathiella limimaris TaxID=1964213 RepID=UPI00146DBDCA|nr:tRNA (cytidine(34)-2'-O)-methyltransferase [Sneathiella limimaris]